jgi:hypothetical protein
MNMGDLMSELKAKRLIQQILLSLLGAAVWGLPLAYYFYNMKP